MKKEDRQTFSFAQYENKKSQKKQIIISKDGLEVIKDESKIQ